VVPEANTDTLTSRVIVPTSAPNPAPGSCPPPAAWTYWRTTGGTA